jgi:hypothetical protein
MNKETEIYIHNGMQLKTKKEWNTVICDTINGTRDNHIKLNKPSTER